MMTPVNDPDDTAPFNQPYGKDAKENPYISPSGPSAQPSGPDYVTPPPPPPTQVPYGAASGTPYGYQPGWAPAYGAPYPGSLNHKSATTSLVLGIVSIVSLLLTPFCCITLPGVFCAPFAWVIGAKAKREMAR